MTLIITIVYIFVMALVLAVLEIQIEGRNGWAKDLCTSHTGLDYKSLKQYTCLVVL